MRAMSIESQNTITTSPRSYRALRIWPALIFLIGMVASPFVPLLVDDGPAMMWMVPAFGPLLCGMFLLLWWICASRATGWEKLVGLVSIVVAILVTVLAADPSMRGAATTMLTIPMGTAAFALGAIAFSRWLSFKRTTIAVLLSVVASGFSTLLRSEGMWGDFSAEYAWRWNQSSEQRMLGSQKATMDLASATNVLADESLFERLTNPEWPGFRGASRAGIQNGPRIDSDWSTHPPELLWKIGVGPGWSSFAVAGKLLFTQEQRGPMETVVCYHADTGEQVWTQSIESRFDEPLGGPGPRATPTLAQGALFVMGAQGWLMKLDPKTGEIAWQQDLRKVANRKPPMWGFSSSPLVVEALVIVYAGGGDDKGTLAFDSDTGALRWSAPASEHSYSSPQLCTINGESTVAMATDAGVDLLDPVTGVKRLSYAWQHDGYRAVQPQMVDANTLLIPTGLGSGTHRIRIAKSKNELTAEELWTSRKLKPDFNDCVIFEGHVYGFDVGIFTCIDLGTGERAWKDGRYGKGQVLLLQDSGLLLVSAERGEVILLQADPAKHSELARMQALKGKTWNHPVVIQDRLYIRNGSEAACYQLPLANRP